MQSRVKLARSVCVSDASRVGEVLLLEWVVGHHRGFDEISLLLHFFGPVKLLKPAQL